MKTIGSSMWKWCAGLALAAGLFVATPQAQADVYLGRDGGLEGTATVDDTVQTAAQAGKWTKNNASQTIAEETTVVRSGGKSIRIGNSTTSGRRVWTPLLSFGSKTTSVTIQYYRQITNSTSFQSNQVGVLRASESLQGTYDKPASINTWEKKTYTPASATFTSLAGVIMHRAASSGAGNMFVDDLCVYDGSADTTAPNSAGTVTIATNSATELAVSWDAASGGVDSGGYLVVRYAAEPAAGDDPNANGIYATNNTLVGSVTGTVVYQGDGTTYTDSGLTTDQTYYYKVYTYDKAYNYAAESNGSGTPASGSASAPSVTTVAAGSIAATTATANGDVTDDGGDTVTERGVCYKTSADVAITDNPTAAAAGGTGEFSVDLSSLAVNQIYYFKAYAINGIGTTLAANELNFTTLANVPAAPTVDNPTATTLDVAVNANGNPAATEFAIQRTSDSLYLQADGTFGAAEDWQTAVEWDTTTAIGLASETEYFFQVKARNGANVETAFGATASGTTAAAPTGIWINPMSAGTPMATFYLGDVMGEWFVNFEIGQTWWDYAQLGIGTSAEGTGYNWGEASWYQDGEGNNKRVRRNLSGYQFTSAANHYVICQAKANSGDDYTSKSGNGWGNSLAYPPADLASAYFAVSAINDPSGQSADADQSTQINLLWSNNAQDHDVMVVRKLAADSWTEPTQGTSYSASDTLGAGTVVYKGDSGIFYDTGLSASTTYDYKFYSVNNDYYSAGVTAQETTLACEPDAPVGLGAVADYTSFTASWDATDRATGYRLDVSTNAAFGIASALGSVYTADFEDSVKGSYASGLTTNNGVVWTFNEAVIGTLANDRKNGSRSARIRSNETVNSTGIISMNSDTNMGLSSITLLYALYGTDASCGGRVEYSTNGGSSWTSAGTFTASSTTLTLFSATNLNVTGNVRVRVVKTSGGSERLNIDDITLYPYSPVVPSFVAGYEDLAVAGTSVSVTGLTEGVTYYFRVRAEGEGGCPSANSGTASVTTLESIGGPQTIDFPAIGEQVVTNVVVLSATASSGLDVSFAVLSGLASLDEDGVTLTFTGAGEVSVVASQAGGGGWDPAAPVTNTFNVAKAAATVTLGDLAQAYDGTARSASVTTVPEGLTVDVTYDGGATPPTAPGSYAVVATVVDDLYQGSDSETLVVSVANPASFSATANGMTAIDLAFAANAAGNDVVIVANQTGTFGVPSGTPPAVGEAFADGVVVYAGTSSPQAHSGLSPCTPYYYKAWSQVDGFYSAGLTDDATTAAPAAPTGLGAAADYTSFVASWEASAGAAGYRLDVSTEADFQSGAAGGLFISEVADPLDVPNAKFVELYNSTDAAIDLGAGAWYLWRQANGGSWTNVQLTGTIAAGGTYVVANSATYDSTFGKAASQYSSLTVSGNGDDGYFLVQGGSAAAMGTVVDVYGVLNQDGTGYAWEYLDKNAVRNADVAVANATWTASEWTIPAGTVNAAAMTPGVHVCEGTAEPSFVTGFENLAVAGTSQLVDGLDEGTTYYFRVRAEGTGGCPSADSATASATTLEHLRPSLSLDEVNVREAGQGRFYVRLNQNPAASVVVSVSRTAGSANLSVQSGSALTFNSANWSTWRLVTLAAAADADSTDDTATFRIAMSGVDDQFVEATALDDDIGENLALPAGGSTIEGKTAYSAAALIDGVHNVQTNYGYTVWTNLANPGTLTLDLHATSVVSRVRLLNYDWNYRVHQYRIDSSLNGTDWTLLADASTGEHTGWEDWPVANQQMRYLRFTGLSNSMNRSVCVSELEVFGTRTQPVPLEFSKTSVNVREAGEGRFYVRMTNAPETMLVVNVALDSGDDSLSVKSGATLTFDALNWNTWKAVTLQAPADENADDETATFRVSAPGVAYTYIEAKALDDDIGENLALGAETEGKTGYLASQLVDGTHLVNTNYGYTVWTNLASPGTITLDLQSVVSASRMRLLNWDFRYRVHQYLIESSTDGDNWSVLVDASTGAHSGWEDWTLDAEQIRYLRFTGLSNSENRAVCISEWELYGEARENQTITFPNPGTQERTNTVVLSATASSGLPVSFAVASGPASISGGTTLTFSGTGLVSIVASQAGDGNWNPAPNVTNVFNVLLPKSTVDFGGGDVNVREGGEGRFFVRLSEQPANDVVVSVTRSAGDAGISVQSGITMTFTPLTWDTWRAVTLVAAEDENSTDESATIRIVATGVPEQFLQAVALDDDIGENVALASGGATVTGSISVAVTDVIDGIHTDRYNYGYTVWTNEPQDVIDLDLGAVMTVTRMRLLNFDWNYRMHQYQIESSLDGETWDLLVDASTGAHHGWEDWSLENVSARYLRFTGLSNTYNRAVCISEWEVYGTRPAGRRAVKAAVAAAAEVVPTVVLTSDGAEDESGWNAVDGDEETAWVGQQVGGGYVVVGYESALELKSIEVDLAEGSLSGIQYLYSQDGEEWLPLPDLAGNPISLNYLWLVFPDDGTMAVPQVLEILPNP